MKKYLFLILIQGSAFARPYYLIDQDKVLYGQDNRMFVSELNPEDVLQVNSAKAILAQIPHWRITDEKDKISILTKNLQTGLNFCEGERFIDQPIVSTCTAFLVAPDLIVTAGHCLKDKYACKVTSWVLDYNSANGFVGPMALVTFSKEKIYNCKELVARSENPKADYAIVRLDRAVIGVEPLKIRREGKVKSHEPLALIGHPLGMPKIITNDILIRDNTSSPYIFKTNVDAFSGNSGSPIIGLLSGLVEGFLVRGEDDFKMDINLGCNRPLQCDGEDCRGESIQRTMVLPFKHIPKL